ncbi:MAG: hypothetical protein J5900_01190 [Prevotella sp.]|nr:hypothetical protein [Prevotella sp.]
MVAVIQRQTEQGRGERNGEGERGRKETGRWYEGIREGGRRKEEVGIGWSL